MMDHRLRALRLVGRVIMAIGVLLLIGGLAFAPTSLWTLIGAMLIIAGVVKEVMIWIWVNLARMGTDDHHPEQAP